MLCSRTRAVEHGPRVAVEAWPSPQPHPTEQPRQTGVSLMRASVSYRSLRGPVKGCNCGYWACSLQVKKAVKVELGGVRGLRCNHTRLAQADVRERTGIGRKAGSAPTGSEVIKAKQPTGPQDSSAREHMAGWVLRLKRWARWQGY